MDHFSKINPQLYSELSADDFQEKLYQWLDGQGILPNLRTYLRHQLITALKRTNLSSDLLNRKRSYLPPGDASLNLLIAEYLVHQNYQYTASIFYSEEPRLGQLPIQLKLANEEKEQLKFFTGDEVEKILESLNLKLGSTFVKQVTSVYLSTSTSLLEASVKSIAKQSKYFHFKKTESSGDYHTEEEDSSFNRSSEKHIKGRASNIKKLQTAKHQQKQSLYPDEEKSQTSVNKQNDIEKRVEDAVLMMRKEMENEIAEQKKSLEKDIMAKQSRIVEMVNHLQDQQVKLLDHMKNVEEKEKLLELKEKRMEGRWHEESIQIAEKQNEIKSSQLKLEDGYQRLHQERNAFLLLQKEMEATHKQITEVANYLGKSKMELDMIQSLNQENNYKNDRQETQLDMKNFSSNSALNLAKSLRSMQENAAQVYQGAIHELREKNDKLLVVADEQQMKINKLSTTVSTLSNQLEEATAALRLLSMQHDENSKIHPMEKPLTFPVKDRLDRQHYVGIRWDNNSVRSHHNSKRKSIQRRLKYDEESLSSSASSPTEEILREAKERLRKLEIESDEVDKRYYKFKQKHLPEEVGITLRKDKKILFPEYKTSWVENIHDTEFNYTRNYVRSTPIKDYVDPTMHHQPDDETNLIAAERTLNRKTKNLNEISEKLSENHSKWISSIDKNALENDRESSLTNCLPPKERKSSLEKQQLFEREDNEIQKDNFIELNDEHLVERNHPHTSNNSTHPDNQIALETVEKYSEAKSDSASFEQLNHSPDKSGILTPEEEIMGKELEESKDSLSNSSTKISVGANSSKGKESF